MREAPVIEKIFRAAERLHETDRKHITIKGRYETQAADWVLTLEVAHSPNGDGGMQTTYYQGKHTEYDSALEHLFKSVWRALKERSDIDLAVLKELGILEGR